MSRIIPAFTQFFDDSGDPLVNGFLQFYESGTNNTDKNTYADINELIPNANPVPLDGAGRCPNVFGTGTYNVISFTSAMVQIQQFDPVNLEATEGAFVDWNSQTIYGEGDIVTGSDGNYYRSIIAGNQNQEPSVSPGQWEEIILLGVWNTSVTYEINDIALLDGIFYRSLTASNIGNDPSTDIVEWRSLSLNSTPDLMENIGFTAAVATKALTFDLKTKGLLDPSIFDSVNVAFRSETLTSGDYDVVSAASALTIVVPDGATLGFAAAATGFVYLYAISNAGAIELAISGSVIDETVLQTTVAIDATADTGAALYSTTLRADVPIRLIGRINIETGAVAGEWDNAPTELFVGTTTDIDTPALAESFESAEQTITSAGALTIAHGLSAAPSLVQARLVCKIAEDGFSIGDELMVNANTIISTSDRGLNITPDSTNINVRYGANSSPFATLHNTTGVHVLLGNAGWRLVVRAWV